jgi:putative membrane protein
MSHLENPQKDRGTVLAEKRTDLAIKRSVIAGERTLMAWIRTAISMIGFGFTIYKFFQYVPLEIAKGNVAHPQAPRNLGLTLIALGTLALAVAAWQHVNFLKEIGVSPFQHMWSISFVVAIAVVLIGLLTFYGVLLRRGPY